MKPLKILLSIICLIAVTACGGGGSSTASTGTSTGDTVTGVATAAQVSVVTAK